ncbi:thioredoxin domain-containing protein [Roseisolibacter sp. H3M3-2]|uniref:DsbA family protein n=1 Tax=Roseisolibacter sp. H3M3-2 TaxID=3031323 RepID=UPI0023DA5352|nr:thioredoxin domain-containing protein [Roseisolibacter sp. H3M3-2]MDF1504179.1 thioredoxin domain-containing protein [Roseisolibacter sp. H3M3-2]
MPLRVSLRRPALVLAALLAAAGCQASGETRAAAATPPATATATAGGEAALPAPGDSTALRALADSGRIGGAPGAKVWLLMVSDFQCPYCKMWHDQSYEAIHKEYVATGKVRVAYLHYPLDQHEQAMPAAEASMCASAQRKFWPYQSALFGSVDRWGKSGDQTAVYESLAQAQGLDMARFRSCMSSHVMRALIEADKDRMGRAGVQSTPSFFVGNQGIAGAQPTDVFRRTLDAAIAAAR